MPTTHDDPPDMIDRAREMPVIGPISSRLERVLGPSCFLSLVLVAVILLTVSKYVSLPLPAMVVFAGLIWVGVLSVLVRWRNPNPDGD